MLAATVSLPAAGHGLKPLDMEFMKQLHDKVNIIPVIAKADTLTEEEIAYFKAQARHATHKKHTFLWVRGGFRPFGYGTVEENLLLFFFKLAWSSMFTTFSKRS